MNCWWLLPLSPFWQRCFCQALARAKMKATQANCLSNLHQMGLAFSMYVSDNNDHLLQLPGAPGGYASAGGYWFIDTAAPQLNNGTQVAALADVQNQLKTNSLLSSYLPNPGANHCPGDVRFNNAIGASGSDALAGRTTAMLLPQIRAATS